MSLWWREDCKSYYADFTVDGARFRVPLDTTDRREALRREKDVIADAKAGRMAARQGSFARLGFNDAVETWIEESAPRLRGRSLLTLRERAKPLKAFFGDTKLSSLSPDAILAYRAARKHNGVANATFNRELDLLRGVLKRAKLWHRFDGDNAVKPLPKPASIGRRLEPDEKARLMRFAATRKTWDIARLAAVLALHTGMRKCEIRGLRWSDVDWLERELRVRRDSTKTDAGERVIQLNADAILTLRELRDKGLAWFGSEPRSEWYVFPGHDVNGKPTPLLPLADDGWRSAWRNLTRAIECPRCGRIQSPATACVNCRADIRDLRSSTHGLRFHDLRHTCIADLLSKPGVTEQTVKAIAGHVSEEMLKTYSHARREEKRAALDSLASSMSRHSNVTVSTPMEAKLVDETGIEPATSSLRTRRSPS